MHTGKRAFVLWCSNPRTLSFLFSHSFTHFTLFYCLCFSPFRSAVCSVGEKNSGKLSESCCFHPIHSLLQIPKHTFTGHVCMFPSFLFFLFHSVSPYFNLSLTQHTQYWFRPFLCISRSIILYFAVLSCFFTYTLTLSHMFLFKSVCFSFLPSLLFFAQWKAFREALYKMLVFALQGTLTLIYSTFILHAQISCTCEHANNEQTRIWAAHSSCQGCSRFKTHINMHY